LSVADRVLITGLGCVSPLGTLEGFWSELIAAHSGIGPLTAFDAGAYRTRIAGQIAGFEPLAYMPAREAHATSRCTQLAVAAASMALADAGVEVGRIDPERTGIYLGTSIGPLAHAIEQHAVFLERGIARVHPLAPAQNYPGAAASEIAILLGIRGPVMTISTACTSGADAIGLALSQLRAGVLDAALVGASEAPLFPLLFAAFDRLALMSRWAGDPARACRPFAADRDGIVLSEGAAVLLLETERAAAARGARALAELAGFGATCDAYHQLQQLPSGEEAARAIRLALGDARASVDEIDYISAHGTGTPANDPLETTAVKQVFGERAHAIPISSIKSMTGHLMGACGALELIACVKSLVDGVLPPTINLESRDPACDLDYVPNEARRASVRTVLSNTFGFGSRNAALVVRAV
jgi:3-oxoacyl-[acyl-carrier-protein] synthase II